MICLQERMMYKMESRVLLTRLTIALVGFDKLIHQLGRYPRHIMLNTEGRVDQTPNSKNADSCEPICWSECPG